MIFKRIILWSSFHPSVSLCVWDGVLLCSPGWPVTYYIGPSSWMLSSKACLLCLVIQIQMNSRCSSWCMSNLDNQMGCVCVWLVRAQYTCGGQGQSRFSPSSFTWVLGLELRLSGLYCQAMSPASGFQSHVAVSWRSWGHRRDKQQGLTSASRQNGVTGTGSILLLR